VRGNFLRISEREYRNSTLQYSKEQNRNRNRNRNYSSEKKGVISKDLFVQILSHIW
jgi:hypothetical protein